MQLRQFQIIKDLQSNVSGSVHLAKATGGVDVVVLKRRKVLEPGQRDDLGRTGESCSRVQSDPPQLKPENKGYAGYVV